MKKKIIKKIQLGAIGLTNVPILLGISASIDANTTTKNETKLNTIHYNAVDELKDKLSKETIALILDEDDNITINFNRNITNEINDLQLKYFTLLNLFVNSPRVFNRNDGEIELENTNEPFIDLKIQEYLVTNSIIDWNYKKLHTYINSETFEFLRNKIDNNIWNIKDNTISLNSAFDELELLDKIYLNESFIKFVNDNNLVQFVEIFRDGESIKTQTNFNNLVLPLEIRKNIEEEIENTDINELRNLVDDIDILVKECLKKGTINPLTKALKLESSDQIKQFLADSWVYRNLNNGDLSGDIDLIPTTEVLDMWIYNKLDKYKDKIKITYNIFNEKLNSYSRNNTFNLIYTGKNQNLNIPVWSNQVVEWYSTYNEYFNSLSVADRFYWKPEINVSYNSSTKALETGYLFPELKQGSEKTVDNTEILGEYICKSPMSFIYIGNGLNNEIVEINGEKIETLNNNYYYYFKGGLEKRLDKESENYILEVPEYNITIKQFKNINTDTQPIKTYSIKLRVESSSFEHDYKWYAWNPEKNQSQKDLITEFLLDENGSPLYDSYGNKILNPKYDPTIDPLIGVKKELVWIDINNTSRADLPFTIIDKTEDQIEFERILSANLNDVKYKDFERAFSQPFNFEWKDSKIDFFQTYLKQVKDETSNTDEPKYIWHRFPDYQKPKIAVDQGAVIGFGASTVQNTFSRDNWIITKQDIEKFKPNLSLSYSSNNYFTFWLNYNVDKTASLIKNKLNDNRPNVNASIIDAYNYLIQYHGYAVNNPNAYPTYNTWENTAKKLNWLYQGTTGTIQNIEMENADKKLNNDFNNWKNQHRDFEVISIKNDGTIESDFDKVLNKVIEFDENYKSSYTLEDATPNGFINKLKIAGLSNFNIKANFVKNVKYNEKFLDFAQNIKFEYVANLFDILSKMVSLKDETIKNALGSLDKSFTNNVHEFTKNIDGFEIHLSLVQDENYANKFYVQLNSAKYKNINIYDFLVNLNERDFNYYLHSKLDMQYWKLEKYKQGLKLFKKLSNPINEIKSLNSDSKNISIIYNSESRPEDLMQDWNLPINAYALYEPNIIFPMSANPSPKTKGIIAEASIIGKAALRSILTSENSNIENYYVSKISKKDNGFIFEPSIKLDNKTTENSIWSEQGLYLFYADNGKNVSQYKLVYIDPNYDLENSNKSFSEIVQNDIPIISNLWKSESGKNLKRFILSSTSLLEKQIEKLSYLDIYSYWKQYVSNEYLKPKEIYIKANLNYELLKSKYSDNNQQLFSDLQNNINDIKNNFFKIYGLDKFSKLIEVKDASWVDEEKRDLIKLFINLKEFEKEDLNDYFLENSYIYVSLSKTPIDVIYRIEDIINLALKMEQFEFNNKINDNLWTFRKYDERLIPLKYSINDFSDNNYSFISELKSNYDDEYFLTNPELNISLLFEINDENDIFKNYLKDIKTHDFEGFYRENKQEFYNEMKLKIIDYINNDIKNNLSRVSENDYEIIIDEKEIFKLYKLVDDDDYWTLSNNIAYISVKPKNYKNGYKILNYSFINKTKSLSENYDLSSINFNDLEIDKPYNHNFEEEFKIEVIKLIKDYTQNQLNEINEQDLILDKTIKISDETINNIDYLFIKNKKLEVKIIPIHSMISNFSKFYIWNISGITYNNNSNDDGNTLTDKDLRIDLNRYSNKIINLKNIDYSEISKVISTKILENLKDYFVDIEESDYEIEDLTDDNLKNLYIKNGKNEITLKIIANEKSKFYKGSTNINVIHLVDENSLVIENRKNNIARKDLIWILPLIAFGGIGVGLLIWKLIVWYKYKGFNKTKKIKVKKTNKSNKK